VRSLDRAEYQEKLDELNGYVRDKDYESALAIVNEIDWKRVKSVHTLLMVADVYDANHEYDDAKRILKLVLNRATIGRTVLVKLIDVSIKLGEISEAEEYFDQYTKVAGNDNTRYVLQYKLFKAKRAPLDAQISVLEEYRDREYTEKWAYELATLYAKAGDTKKCVDTCDDLILWFGEGRYVLKAMELKMKYEPLSSSQKRAYEEQKAQAERAAASRPKRRIAADPAEMKDRLQESFDDVVSGMKSEAAPIEEPAAKLDNTVPLDQLHISDLEPDHADTSVIDARGTAESIVSRPETAKKKETPKPEAEEARVWTDVGINRKKEKAQPKKDEEIDLDSLLKETAGSFASEIARGDFGTKKDEEKTKEPEEVPTGEIAELESEKELGEPAEADIEEKRGAAEEKTSKKKKGFHFFHRHEEEEEETAASGKTGAEPEASAKDAEPSAKEAAPSEEKTEPAEAGDAAQAAAAGEKSEAEARAKSETEERAKSEAEQRARAEAEARAKEEARAKAERERRRRSDAFRESIRSAVEKEEQERRAKEDAEGLSDTKIHERILFDESEADRSSRVSGEAAAAHERELFGTSAAPERPAGAGRRPKYNEELEVPDPEPSADNRLSHSRTLDLSKVGENTIPVSLDEIIMNETPEERRIRFLHNEESLRMNDDQRKIFTYFARIPGMDNQILSAMTAVYQHADEHTSSHGNLAVMGAEGSGKSKLTQDLILAMCLDLGMDAAKVARISGYEMNSKDPARVVSKISGGFLMIEECSEMNDETVASLSKAMDFRTDRMILIIEDEKAAMRGFLKKHPEFAGKIEKVISIPIFTNDELITFARTYAEENQCKIDDMAVLALYTIIGNNQSYEEPMTIARVKSLIDRAITHARKGQKHRGRGRRGRESSSRLVLQEKDFETN
jgi:hypothetical protein